MPFLDPIAVSATSDPAFAAAQARRVAKERGILLASVGLGLALAALLLASMAGIIQVPFRSWALAAGVSGAVQWLLWFIPHRGWDAWLTWDRHYLILPMLCAAALLSLYSYIAPEARALVLVGWVVGLIFMAGLGGFMEVVILSATMTLGYLLVVRVHYARGALVYDGLEAVLTMTFLIISIYAGVVFERLRRERREMRRMREELRHLAATDPLTGLPNRRRFEEVLHAELARVARYGGRCSVALLDVDHFKNYNDACGHIAGDKVLRELAALMRKHTRVSDVVARYGGEEFALIMVNAPADEAAQAVERLRAVIEQHAFEREEVQPGGALTLSAGIANCPDDAHDFESLLKKADDALYTAKRQGRNRVQAAVVAT